MPTDPINTSVRFIDLTDRIKVTTTIVASPALAAETIIAQLTPISNLTIVTGVDLSGWVAYTVGTSGTAVELRIRQTGLAGAVKADTGALTGSQHGAAILTADDVEGFDTAPAAGQVYVLTMQVTAGAAVSTVSAVKLRAIVS
jgi:hypothetical protein